MVTINGDTGIDKVQSGVVEDGDLVNAPYKMVLGTAVASTSGTSVDFTGIPSWAKRITVMFNGVSTNGTSAIQVQIGSGTIQTLLYAGVCMYSTNANNIATGFPLGMATSGASDIRFGSISISNLGSNFWTQQGNIAYNNASLVVSCAGGVQLSGALDRVRITTVNGTDLFDAGSINIMYEG